MCFSLGGGGRGLLLVVLRQHCTTTVVRVVSSSLKKKRGERPAVTRRKHRFVVRVCVCERAPFSRPPPEVYPLKRFPPRVYDQVMSLKISPSSPWGRRKGGGVGGGSSVDASAAAGDVGDHTDGGELIDFTEAMSTHIESPAAPCPDRGEPVIFYQHCDPSTIKGWEADLYEGAYRKVSV